MAELDYLNVLALAGVAVLAPLLSGLVPLAIPEVVLQIIGGIIIGPSVLGWVHIDAGVEILSTLGLAYLLFISGMEIEPAALRGRLMPLALWAFAASVAIAVTLALALGMTGLIDNRGLIIAALITTSMGIVVTVLKDHGQHSTPVGQLTLISAALADFGSVALLSVIFVDDGSSAWAPVAALGLFALAAIILLGAIVRLGAIGRITNAFGHWTGGATQIQVRASFALMVGFAALAQTLGLEAILGAFAAGVIISVLDSSAPDREVIRGKLEAVGFGVLAPMFFVTSGVSFDLGALTASSEGMLLIPILVLSMVLCRALPTALFLRTLGWRQTLASGLLLSSKLTFVVAAVEIGRRSGELAPSTGSALIAAGLITVLVMPTLASSLLDGPAPGAGPRSKSG